MTFFCFFLYFGAVPLMHETMKNLWHVFFVRADCPSLTELPIFALHFATTFDKCWISMGDIDTEKERNKKNDWKAERFKWVKWAKTRQWNIFVGSFWCLSSWTHSNHQQRVKHNNIKLTKNWNIFWRKRWTMKKNASRRTHRAPLFSIENERENRQQLVIGASVYRYIKSMLSSVTNASDVFFFSLCLSSLTRGAVVLSSHLNWLPLVI